MFVGGTDENRNRITASYGRVYVQKGEIAGHHIVYGITSDDKKELVVRAVPLQHYPDFGINNVFDASDFLDSTNPSVTLDAWLPTLALSISMDQGPLAKMRFDPRKSTHGHWSCPIRTMLMWSGQASSSGFLPHVPNPLRAGRMYRDIMTPYVEKIDVHPTTKAKPIDYLSRLHIDYWTTNGFCVYLGGGGASFPAPASEKCSLYALARSLFDGQYNDYTTVFGSTTTTCIDQVDWPYTPFHGRDNSFAPSSTAPQCAVLDRLPHFQYRIKTDAPFVPSGVKTTESPGMCMCVLCSLSLT